MQTLRQDIAYALRQMRQSPVFTLTAMLTLALGIGATTAIFSLIHTVMLKSLPVVDPSSLYRIGEGQDCCVEGSPQDNWGMFSYPFYQRMKKNTPEFAELAAFQAGGWSASARAAARATAWPSPCAANSSAAITSPPSASAPSPDAPSAPPTISPPPRRSPCSAIAPGSSSTAPIPRIVGSTFILDGHPFTIIGITPPGFFGETLRSDPPELWLPIQQEPLFSGANSFLHHFQAWLRVIGRAQARRIRQRVCPRA